MREQVWYSVHAQQNQTQIVEESDEFRDLLNRCQISRSIAFIEQIKKSYISHQGKRAFVFYCLKYNVFSNITSTQPKRLAIFGVKGEHQLDRKTDYAHIYLAEEEEVLGTSFFQYIFDSYYPMEEEMRVNSIRRNVNQRVSSSGVQLVLNQKHVRLVCRIVERLWRVQLENSAARLVLCMRNEDIEKRSMMLLRQVYMLLPQRLRLNMGFAVNSTFADIKMLTEDCDLPVHLFTMGANNFEEIREKKRKINLKYPVFLFDVEDFEKEEYDLDWQRLLWEIGSKISASTDRKMAYLEKKFLKEMHCEVSFQYFLQVLQDMREEEFCWWNEKHIGNIQNIFVLYEEQCELMEDENLRKEALNAFHTKFLQDGGYAGEISKIYVNEYHEQRDSLLEFLKEKLQIAGVLEIMYELQRKVEQKKELEKTNALLEAEREKNLAVSQERRKHERKLEEKNQQLETKSKELQTLREKQEQREQEYIGELKQQEQNYESTIRDLKSKQGRILEEKKSEYERQLNRREMEYQEALKKKEQECCRMEVELIQKRREVAEFKEKRGRKLRKLQIQKGMRGQRIEGKYKELQKRLNNEQKEREVLHKKERLWKWLMIMCICIMIISLGCTVIF